MDENTHSGRDFTYSESRTMESWGTDRLRAGRMLSLPVVSEWLERIALWIDVVSDTELAYAFHQGPENQSTWPEAKLMENRIRIVAGEKQWIELPIAAAIARPGWHFLILEANPQLAVHMAETPPGKRWSYPRPDDPIRPNPFTEWTSRSLVIGMKRSVEADGASVVTPDWNDHARSHTAESGFLHFAYLCRATPEQRVFEPCNVANGHSRPTNQPNLWVSQTTDFSQPEWLELTWKSPRDLTEIQLLFDSSLHFHFWQSWQGYQTNAIPSLVRDYRLIATRVDGSQTVIAEVTGNFQRNRRHEIEPENLTALRLEIFATHGVPRAQVYAVRALG